MYAMFALVTALVAAVSARDIQISVGKNGNFTFEPPVVNASVGDNLLFMFESRNHSVWQSSFAAPCSLVDKGFASPFFPVNASSGQIPVVTIQVMNTTPIWFYCAQQGHCQMGMVGAVNPTPSKTFAQFQAAAMGLANTTASNGTTSSASPGSTSPSSSSTSTSTTSSASPSPSAKNSAVSAVSLNVGQLLAGVAVIAILAL